MSKKIPIIVKDEDDRVIVMDEGSSARITIPGQVGKVCIYVTQRRGKLFFQGGASLIEGIAGEGMLKKIKK